MGTNKSILIVLLLLISLDFFSQIQVDKFSGDAFYGLPLITVPNFRGPSISTSISYRSDIKMDQPASEIGLGWDINAGGSVERVVNGVPDDWKNGRVPDVQSASFREHVGALYFNESTSGTPVFDFDYTRYKMDTLNDTIKYYYPNYDNYYVTGMGMGGKIIPENYDYMTIEVDTATINRWFYHDWWWDNGVNPPIHMEDSTSVGIRSIENYSFKMGGLYYKTHFTYQHNMYGEVDSEYYTWNSSPLNATSTIRTPGELTGPTYGGSGYNNEDFGEPANRNRTRTSNYIEYFTNAEIDTGVTGFIEYDTIFDRSVEANFPQAGIGAYRITDPNGYTYHYSLPVYAHYSASGSASLDKNYNVIAQGDIKDIIDSSSGYLVEDDQTTEIYKIKQTKKYAIRWLLTAVTGPDYIDSNSDNVVDIDDAGYWVKYDYGLWTEEFETRFPYAGASYSFSSSIDQKLWATFMDDSDSSKMTGKQLSYAETSNQVYYLNKIQSPSHTGVFVRDYRKDEQSTIRDTVAKTEYSETLDLITKDTLTEHSGSGRLDSEHPLGANFSHDLLIEPTDYNSVYNKIDLTLSLGVMNENVDFWLNVYDGNTKYGTLLLARYDGDGLGFTADVSAYSGAIFIEIGFVDPYLDPNSAGTYYGLISSLNWSTTWEGTELQYQKKPQLKLSQMFLFDNNDLSNLPSLTSIDTTVNDPVWDYFQLNRDKVYHRNWYLTNETLIDSLALQSIDLEQDYSLAKGYINNRHVLIENYSKIATQVEIEDDKEIEIGELASSGKLTLNKVVYYGLNRVQTQPSHLFEYNALDTNDNPQYNSLLQDCWGNYKSDGEGNLLRGYVSDVSKNKTDAWSLRKVTTPLGGTTEIIYESDEYEQVLSEDNGGALRGPIKTFALKNVYPLSGEIGVGWKIELENQTTDFWNLNDSLPEGAIIYAAIPSVWVDGDEQGSANHYFEDGSSFSTAAPLGFAISSGLGELTKSEKKITGLNYVDINNNFTPITEGLTSTEYPWNDGESDSLVYASNGYVSYEYPLGEKVYGGGTRVKELKTSNGIDVYKIVYTYDGGTATSEVGDFSKRKQKNDGYGANSTGGFDQVYDWGLTSVDYNPFGAGPQVGYGKVSVENKGQVTHSEGKSTSFYQVSDQGFNNFKLNIGRKDTSWYIGPQPPVSDHKTTSHGVEYIDDFSSMWGKIIEQRLEDLHGNIVSKKVYEYETSTKGAHVQTLNYEVDRINLAAVNEATNVVCIFRTLPSYLKKVTTYSNGRKSVSEILDRDIFTGNPIESKLTSINGTETRSETIMAHTQTGTPDYSTMGAKSDDPTYDNFLNNTYSAKGYKESKGISNSSITGFTKSFWKETVKTRVYNTGTNVYTNSTEDVQWYDYTKYVYTGPIVDENGLFKESLVSDITAPVVPTSQDWRMTSEITLMDENQNVLEQKDFKNRFSASKLGYDNRFTYTSASNANYVSFTGTGFETKTEVEAGVDYYEGEMLSQAETKITDDLVGANVIEPHTGNYMVKVPTSSNGPLYQVKYDEVESIHSLQRGRIYSASVWVHKDSKDDAELIISLEGTLDGTYYSDLVSMRRDDSDTILIGDWIQLNVNIEVPSNFEVTYNGSGTLPGLKVYVKTGSQGMAWFDDLQFHSRVTGSGMNVYDQKTGRVMATLSDNNFATKYVYNDAGQVIEVWKEVLEEGWVKVESKAFNFKREME